jgi:hypothetical protein
MQPEILHEDGSFLIAFWHNVCIVDAWGEIDAPRMRMIGDRYRVLLKRYPQGILAICALRPNTPVSSSEARAESVRFLKELGDKMLHLAFVVEADGVLGLMLRSVLRGINALVRPGRIVIVEGVDRAVQVCAPHVASELRHEEVAQQLKAAISSLRSRFKGPLRSAAPNRPSPF